MFVQFVWYVWSVCLLCLFDTFVCSAGLICLINLFIMFDMFDPFVCYACLIHLFVLLIWYVCSVWYVWSICLLCLFDPFVCYVCLIHLFVMFVLFVILFDTLVWYICSFLFIIIMTGFLDWIGWSVCISKYERILSVLFSISVSGWYIYHFSIRAYCSNKNLAMMCYFCGVINIKKWQSVWMEPPNKIIIQLQIGQEIALFSREYFKCIALIKIFLWCAIFAAVFLYMQWKFY